MSFLDELKTAGKVSNADFDLAGYAGRKAAEVIASKVRMWGPPNEERLNDLFAQAEGVFEAMFAERGYQPDMVQALTEAANETCIAHYYRLEIEAEVVRRL